MNIEEEVYSQCKDKECGGKFYIIDDEIRNCKCFPKLVRYNKYNKAKIPIEWWNFTSDDIAKSFDKNILKKYIFFRDNIKECMNNKVDFWFYGSVGAGKTTIAYLMLKDILDANYKGIMLNGFEVIDYLYHDRKNEIDECDFIVIDEMDKVKKNTIPDFCDLVSSYFGKKSIVLLGNKDIESLKINGYPEFFIDRLKSLHKITFKSDSYRKNRKSTFEVVMEVNK